VAKKKGPKPSDDSSEPEKPKKPRRAPVPQPHGGALVPGAGGGPQPGAGRPADEFKRMCRELASSKEVFAKVKKILKDDEHPLFMPALKWATENGYVKEILTVASPEVQVRLQQQAQVIASRPTWDSKELLKVLGEEVWK
jgi:hypothetical protein